MHLENGDHDIIPHPSREERRTMGDNDGRQQTRTKMSSPE